MVKRDAEKKSDKQCWCLRCLLGENHCLDPLEARGEIKLDPWLIIIHATLPDGP